MRKYLIVAILFLSSCQKNTSVGIPPPVDFKGEILFSTFYSDTFSYGYQLNLVNGDGTNRRILPNKLMLYSSGFPSHNGKKIAYNVPNNVGTSDLYLIDIDGQNETLVARNAYGKEWSHDDTRLAFMRDNSFNYRDIYTINTDGSNEVKLTNKYANSFPQFLPDNSGIIFDSSPDLYSNASGIYKMNMDGSNKQLLTPANKSYTSPIVSPDGKKIAAFVYSACNCKELVMMNTDGSGLKQITFSGTGCVSPSWSPDSRRLAYTVKKSQTSADIYVCTADGTGTTKITDGSYGNDCPTWSKDGNYIAYMSGRGSLPGQPQSGIWISRADGLSHARVTNDIKGFIYPVIIQK